MTQAEVKPLPMLHVGRVRQIDELVALVDAELEKNQQLVPPYDGGTALLHRLKVKITQLSMNLDWCLEDAKEARATNKSLEQQLRSERTQRRNLADQLSAYMRAAGEDVAR